MTLPSRTLFAIAPLLWACGLGGVDLRLQNVGSENLTDVVIHTTGRHYPIGALRPGQAASLRVCADDDSNITVEHGPAASRRRFELDVYVDHHCTGTVRAMITADSLVSRRWIP